MINVLEMLSKRRMALQQKKNKIQEEANQIGRAHV